MATAAVASLQDRALLGFLQEELLNVVSLSSSRLTGEDTEVDAALLPPLPSSRTWTSWRAERLLYTGQQSTWRHATQEPMRGWTGRRAAQRKAPHCDRMLASALPLEKRIISASLWKSSMDRAVSSARLLMAAAWTSWRGKEKKSRRFLWRCEFYFLNNNEAESLRTERLNGDANVTLGF